MARRQPRCKHPGCKRPRFAKHFLCSLCWSRVPAWLRAKIVRAKKQRMPTVELEREAHQQVAAAAERAVAEFRARHAAAAPSPYQQIAAITGDRDLDEAAE